MYGWPPIPQTGMRRAVAERVPRVFPRFRGSAKGRAPRSPRPEALVRPDRRVAQLLLDARRMAGCHGIWGRPYLDLTRFLDISRLADIDAEACWALAQIESSYTGGTLKWMGVVSPEVAKDGFV